MTGRLHGPARRYSASTASSTRAEYTTAAPAFIAIATGFIPFP